MHPLRWSSCVDQANRCDPDVPQLDGGRTTVEAVDAAVAGIAQTVTKGATKALRAATRGD